MAFEEINNLKERLAKDPASKLFLPLSEEYRKAGMLDEAIEVLRRGLDTHPSYMSARVALGKIYHEKGMLQEAVEELEKVTRAIPDNLFAHRKLAEIYRETGEAEKASREFEAVLGLNPLDDEARAHVERPAACVEEHPGETEPVTPEPAQGLSDEGHEAEPAQMQEEEDSYFAVQAPESGGSPADYEEFARAVNPDSRSFDEVPREAAGGIRDPLAEEPGEWPSAPSFLGPEEVGEETGVAEPPPADTDRGGPTHAEFVRAEEFISRDEFPQAFTAYRDLLRRYPSDRHVLQKVEELRSYLRMINRDRDEDISKMESFLNGIRRRKDEFLRSA